MPAHFKIWLINFDCWAIGSWIDLESAIAAAKSIGFECSVQECVDTIHDTYLDRAFVSPLRGVERR